MSDPQLATDRLIPVVHWNEYEVDSDPEEAGGTLSLSLYSSDSELTDEDSDPIAVLKLSATETLDLINALAGELPFLTPNEGD